MAYGSNRRSQAGKRSNGGPGNPNKKDRVTGEGVSSGKMTRKDAKAFQADAKSAGHKAGNMSVRKIKKSGTKAKF